VWDSVLFAKFSLCLLSLVQLRLALLVRGPLHFDQHPHIHRPRRSSHEQVTWPADVLDREMQRTQLVNDLLRYCIGLVGVSAESHSRSHSTRPPKRVTSCSSLRRTDSRLSCPVQMRHHQRLSLSRSLAKYLAAIIFPPPRAS